MELKATTQVTFPRPLVFSTYRDRLPETVPYLPNVASIVVKERTEEAGRVKLVNLWSGKTDIPSMAKKFIKAEMLQWTDFAEWDESAFTCAWRIETHAFPGLVECSGKTFFLETGTGTELRIDGQLILHLEKAHVPRLLAGTVQPLIERLVITSLKPNLLSTGEGIQKFLAAGGAR